MIRKLFTIILSVTMTLLVHDAQGQTTVTFGTGTSASSTYGPFYRSSATSPAGSAKGIMFSPGELSTAGIVSGSNITSIAFQKASGSVLANGATATAILYAKDGSSFADYGASVNVFSHKASGFVPVDTVDYNDNTNNISGANSWVGFNFNWTYTGGNLEFYIEWSITNGTSTSATTGSFTWNYSSTTPNYRYIYENGVPSSTDDFTRNVNRTNTQITFIAPPACSGIPNPGTISGPSVVCSGTAATLAVTGQSIGTGLAYQWESRAVGSSTWNTIPSATGPSYTTPALGNQDMEYQVTVTCQSVGGGSATANSFTVSPSYAPPYFYSFTGFPSECWAEADGVLSSTSVLSGTTGSWAAETWLNATNGSDVVHNNFASASDNEWLISPSVNLGTGGNYQLEFDIAFVQDGSSTPAALGTDDTLAVVISTDNGVTWSIANVIKLYTAATSALPTGYEHVVIPLNTYSGRVKFAFYASEGVVDDPADTDGMVDNFRVRLAPTCPEPLVPTVTGAASTSAGLSWVEGGTATQWEVQYGALGFTPGTGTSVMASSNPFILPGLAPLTTYDAYVRAVCGPNDSSSWSGPISFTTACASVTLPYTENFATYTPICWEERDGQLTSSSAISVASSVWAGDDWLNDATLGPAAKILLSVATDRDWLVSPSVNLGSSVPYQLEFDLALVASGSSTSEALGSDDTLAVVVSTDDGLTWGNSNILYAWTSANSAIPGGTMHVILPLTSYTGAIRIGFYGSEGTVNDLESVDAMIDNFSIVAQPSCPQPTFLSVNGVSSTSATLGWTQTGTAAQWQIEYGPGGFTQGSGTTAIVNSNPYTLTGLSATSSYTYYVRAICGPTDTSLWSGPVNFSTPPPNDSAVNATLLTMGGICDGISSNGTLAGATVEAGEPNVSCEGSAGNFRSVWYKFIAPASGQVKVSSDYTVAAPDSVVDSKMAVYQVGDSSNFMTYQIIACDDDNGVVGTGYRNIIYVTNLTPGGTYYVKYDKWNLSEVDGSFCISVEEFTPSMISSNPNCGATAYGNNDWFTGGNAWVSVVDNSGLVIANLKSNASTSIGSVFSRLHQNTGAIRVFGSQPYLDRNYEITVDNQPSSPVDIQFFFTDADYNALAAADPNVSMNSLGATRLPTAICAAVYDTVGQAEAFLPQTGNGSNNGVRYIVVPTPGFSSFFIHAGNGPLEISLSAISATNVNQKNRINWTTAVEALGDNFVVERSADGRLFSSIGELLAKGSASEYAFWDESPYGGINYYRLRMTGASGKHSYSTVVTAVVKGGGGFALEAYPNPTSGQVTVKTIGDRSGNASIRITDLLGKVLYQQEIDSEETLIDLQNFPAGIYLVRYDDDLRTKSIKVTIQ